MDDSESYLGLFRDHAKSIARLMKAMDEEVTLAGLPSVGRPKELFRMALDLTYQVDRAYKKKHNIEESNCFISSYLSREQMQDEMRNIFVEEFNRFLSLQNENK